MYDNLDRLSVYTKGNVSKFYDYDKNGNIMIIVINLRAQFTGCNVKEKMLSKRVVKLLKISIFFFIVD